MAPQLNKGLEGEHGDVADPVNRLAVSVGLAAFFFTTNLLGHYAHHRRQ